MVYSEFEKEIRAFATRHGFRLRIMPASYTNPNGYIRIEKPTGGEINAINMGHAMDIMVELVSGKPKILSPHRTVPPVDNDLWTYVVKLTEDLHKSGEASLNNEEMANQVYPFLKNRFPDLYLDVQRGQKFVTAKGLKKYRVRLRALQEQHRQYIDEITASLETLDRHFKSLDDGSESKP